MNKNTDIENKQTNKCVRKNTKEKETIRLSTNNKFKMCHYNAFIFWGAILRYD